MLQRGTIGEGYEADNYGSWARVAICVARVRRRAFSISARHCLLAQQSFRRECGLERRTTARRALCCRSKKNSYGSKVAFHDAECMAVDTGPDVVNRKAARSCGRSTAQRDAIVIDRFFQTKQKALAWANANQDFMTVRILMPDKE